MTPDTLEPPWDDLDPGILQIVRALYDAGLIPWSSCQGGEGHVNEAAFVLLAAEPEEAACVEAKAARVLGEMSPCVFEISPCTRYYSDGRVHDVWPFYVAIMFEEAIK